MQWYISTLPVKSFWTVRFWMFFKEFSSAHQACIYLILNTAKAVILWYVLLFKILLSILNIFKMYIILRSKLNFQYHYSSLQCHIQNYSIMLIFCSRKFLHIYILLLSIFKTVEYFFPGFLMNRKIQRSAFIWNKKAFVTYTIPFKRLESV